ncbi:MAG: AMP-binding protein [Alphaproteobacteria bacterium]|nr:AMP-binding protein [Alphaproteobacteria bacterium]
MPIRPRKASTRRAGITPRRALRTRLALSPYDQGLERNAANYQPLTPLSFLERAAQVFPDHIAIVHGQSRFTYSEFYARSRRLASALVKAGVKKNDTVAAMTKARRRSASTIGTSITSGGMGKNELSAKETPASAHHALGP